MNKTRTIVVVVVFVLVIAFGIGQFFAIPATNQVPGNANDANATSTPSTGPATNVVHYVPVAASSTKTEEGSCWTSSIAAPFRSDAWRCTVGNSISDPCFQIPGSKNLLCDVNPAKPNATSSIVLKLTKPLPAPETAQGEPPLGWAWLLRLSDGTICSPFTGTLPIVQGGISANYGCAPKAKGEEGLLIFGDLNTSSTQWTADTGLILASTSSLPTIRNEAVMPVETVWE